MTLATVLIAALAGFGTGLLAGWGIWSEKGRENGSAQTAATREDEDHGR